MFIWKNFASTIWHKNKKNYLLADTC